MAYQAEIICGEAELWDSFRGGSDAAFSQVYTRFADLLYSYGCRLHPDKELVKDCLQDLFVTLWHKKDKLGPTTSVKYYLFRCFRRELVRKLKQHKTSQEAGCHTAAEDSVERLWINAEQNLSISHALNLALSRLSERQREAVYLRFYQNMDFEDIALLMGITQRAVYKLIYRAIDVLKKSYMSSCSSGFPPLSVSHSEVQLPVLLLALFK